jgi:small nuclear ribonucleoprotein (snRNP)-like protein
MKDSEEIKGTFLGISTQSNVVLNYGVKEDEDDREINSVVSLKDIRGFLINFIQLIEEMDEDPEGNKVEDIASVLRVRVKDIKDILEVLGNVLENGSYQDEMKMQIMEAELRRYHERTTDF